MGVQNPQASSHSKFELQRRARRGESGCAPFVKATCADAGYFLIAAGDRSGAAGDAQCHRCGAVSLAAGYYHFAGDRTRDRGSGADFIVATIFPAALRAV